MPFIKFCGSEEIHNCGVELNGNIVTLTFADKITVNANGFRVYADAACHMDIGGDDYEGFTTVYRYDEETAKYNGYQLSRDGSRYIPQKKEKIAEAEEEKRKIYSIEVTVDKTQVTINAIRRDGGQGTNGMHFNFSEEWNGCLKAASVYVDGKEIAMLLDKENHCKIPEEATEKSFALCVTGIRTGKLIKTEKKEVANK